MTEAATGSGAIAASISGVASGAAEAREVLEQMGAWGDDLARMSNELLRARVTAFTYRSAGRRAFRLRQS